MTFNPQPKPVKWRSEKYKDFIRDLNCAKCNRPGRNTFQHENMGLHGLGKGTSTKISDIYGISLCSECHGLREHIGAEKFWGDRLELLPFKMLNDLNQFLAGEK